MIKLFVVALGYIFLCFSYPLKIQYTASLQNQDTLIYPGEHHFKNMRQLTFGGDNAEAYFSFDGKYIIY